MQKRFHSFNIALSASLGLALGLGSVPADASEVVKLARLVITGKRLSAERLEPVAMQKTTAPLARTAQLAPSAQAPMASGQDALPRASVTPSRGVLSFF